MPKIRWLNPRNARGHERCAPLVAHREPCGHRRRQNRTHEHRRLIQPVAQRALFPSEALRTQIRQPLMLTETTDKFDILATVVGGGVSGQAGAVRLGIARALVEYNLELRKSLKNEGLLTRDARAKERKKYGMAGARKRFQFSKR